MYISKVFTVLFYNDESLYVYIGHFDLSSSTCTNVILIYITNRIHKPLPVFLFQDFITIFKVEPTTKILVKLTCARNVRPRGKSDTKELLSDYVPNSWLRNKHYMLRCFTLSPVCSLRPFLYMSRSTTP